MRPKIICHMVSSIDGRLHPSRFTVPAAGVDGARLRKHYDEVAARFGAQGWMCGRVTMQEISKGKPRQVTGPGVSSREPFVGDRKDRDLAIAIDPKGRVHYGQDNLLGDHAVAVLSETVSDAYLAELREDGVSYLFAGPDGRDLAKAMDALGEAFGVETILLQGGASINGSFLKAGLIDEMSVLIQPAVDGLAGVQSIFDYQGEADERPGAGQALRHLHTETLEGGMVWLRYKVEDAPAGA
ncbi:dihydrofolate reductase family protein [Methylorubrum rhodesianum]|uniref:RibD family protein n=1 Tax=Methylorubrum TaxID=2282523 RepID=UPI00160EE8C8|nr:MULTISPECIES: dihydrofolate reductase family protein [Methylorubrum]MBB5764785.1 5-amino-6-(5-phosphoribosylamino)uracil reductase [Methylorubrum rhodesianum]MBI1691391.1 RibD family protein [Methylorubrum sp. DB1722]